MSERGPEKTGPEPLNRARLLHPVNVVLAAITLGFIVWEIVAALMDKGRFSVLVTLSEYVWFARNVCPWVMYPAITIFCAWLWIHFVFQGPR